MVYGHHHSIVTYLLFLFLYNSTFNSNYITRCMNSKARLAHDLTQIPDMSFLKHTIYVVQKEN